MGLLRKLVVLMLFWLFLGSTSVFAQSHNHRGYHQKHITSPFEAKKKAISLHCLLKLHGQREFCPHTSATNSKSIPVKIASDCGGKTSEANPKTASFNYDFTEAISLPLIRNDLSSVIDPNQIFYHDSFADSPPPPPRSI